mmetsp:Transcript_24569/g.27329  ORF Transcript_24569/g.27329 Transcript_24569/m.27329 type:complete len:275 (+) Transcript_24569:62-886(+)
MAATQEIKVTGATGATKRPRRWHSFGPNNAIRPVKPLFVKRRSSEKISTDGETEVTLRVSQLNTSTPAPKVSVKQDHIMVLPTVGENEADGSSDQSTSAATEQVSSPPRKRVSLVASTPRPSNPSPVTRNASNPSVVPKPTGPVVSVSVEPPRNAAPKKTLPKNLRVKRRANSLSRPPTRTARRTYRGLGVDELNTAKLAFQKYDEDRDGKINRESFYLWVHDVMVSRNKRLGKRLLKRLADMHWSKLHGGRKTEEITFDEFLRVYSYLILDFV